MNDAQKLAWAEENGVTPPAFFLARIQRSRSAKFELACNSQRGACCAGGRASHDCDTGATMDENHKSHDPIVPFVSMMRCKGLHPTLVTIPPSVAPGLLDLISPRETSEPAPMVTAAIYDSPSREVATPPPNVALN